MHSKRELFPLNYTSTPGIGSRARQHFFPNQKDITEIFRNYLSDIEQTLILRTSNLKELAANQLPLIITPEDDQMYNIEHARWSRQNGYPNVDMLVSFRYHEPKWDFARLSNTDFTPKANNKVTDAKEIVSKSQRSSLQKAYLKDIDVEKDTLRSTRSKTMLTVAKDDLDKLEPRQNAYFNLAFDWERTFYYYNDVYQRFNDIQMQESMWRRLANQHAVSNYKSLVATFTNEVVNNPNDPYALHKISFTYDPVGTHRVSRNGALLEGIIPKEISRLSANEYGYKMFQKSFVSISPKIVSFDNAEILCTQQEKVKLKNKSKSMILEVDEILTSSPEIHVILPGKDLKWPIFLKPGEEVEFIVLVVPEIKGFVNEALYIPINKKYLYFLPVTINAVPNPLQLMPVFYTDVAVGQTIRHFIKLTAPEAKKHVKGDVEVVEVYKTETFIDLYWPNGRKMSTEISESVEMPPKDYWTVSPGQTKAVLEVRFNAKEHGDHRAVVHIYTNQGILVRLPFYYHVTRDPIRMTPTIVDFGFVPFRFDTIVIEVYCRLRTPQTESLTVDDILFPIGDERLDFMPGRWAYNDTYIVKHVVDDGRVYELHKPTLTSKDVHLCSVALKPYKFGMINEKIKLKLKNALGVLTTVEVPIVGYVSPDAYPLRSYSGYVRKENTFKPRDVPYSVGFNDLGDYNI